MKYFIWVLGCAMNNSDAERISAILDLLGYKKTEKESEADLIITVACSVRQHAIDRIYGKAKVWRKLKAQNPKLKTILTGCVLENDRQKMEEMFNVIFNIDDLGKLPEILGRGTVEEESEFLGKSGEYLGIVPAYESSFRAYVPIMTGCDNFCTYCAVPYTRGREKSRPEEEIIIECKTLIAKGFREITLLGQNVNSYRQSGTGNQGKNNGFVELLKKIDKIPGDFRVYFYSNHPKDISDELINIMPTLKHFPAYIHLPLQSGNDRILNIMNRHYTKDEYLNLVAKIKKSLPDVTLTTDIMVGFPGEGVKEFADTVDVMKKAKYDMAFIAQYSSRPGTASVKFDDDVPKIKKADREKELVRILSHTALENNKKLIGSIQKVLIDGKKGNNYYGRTEGYKVVEIEDSDHPERENRAEGSPIKHNKLKTQKILLGQFYYIKIKSVTAWKLNGTVV